MLCMKSRTIDWYELYKGVGMEFTEQDRDAFVSNVDVTKVANANYADGVFEEARHEPA